MYRCLQGKLQDGKAESESETFFEEETCSESEPAEPPAKRAKTSDAKTAKEAADHQVRRVKESLETRVVTALANVPRPELKAIQTCVRSLPSELRLFPPCTSYCYTWMMGKRCRKTCKYLHRKVPEGSIGKSMAISSLGQFAIQDTSKQVSNDLLYDVAADLEEQRCFVLDGAKGATIRSLRRPPDRILSPNVDASAAKALQGKSLSVHASSFTTLVVALQAKVHFGCVYLDYMWPLDYFESTQREVQSLLSKHRTADREQQEACRDYCDALLTDGLHDVELLVLNPGHSLLSPTGAVLAVTMVHSPKSKLAAQRARLEQVLIEGAELHQVSLNFMGYTKPGNRPVATYFYGWNLQCQLELLPNVSKKLKKHCFLSDSRSLYTPESSDRSVSDLLP